MKVGSGVDVGVPAKAVTVIVDVGVGLTEKVGDTVKLGVGVRDGASPLLMVNGSVVAAAWPCSASTGNCSSPELTLFCN